MPDGANRRITKLRSEIVDTIRLLPDLRTAFPSCSTFAEILNTRQSMSGFEEDIPKVDTLSL